MSSQHIVCLWGPAMLPCCPTEGKPGSWTPKPTENTSHTAAEQCHGAAPRAGPGVAAVQAVLARQAVQRAGETSAGHKAPAPPMAQAPPAVQTELVAHTVLSARACPALQQATGSPAGALLGCEQGVMPPATPRCLSGKPAGACTAASSAAPLVPAVQASTACSAGAASICGARGAAGAAPTPPAGGSGNACSAGPGLSRADSVGGSAARAASEAQVHAGHMPF